ncbi:MAG TPA: histidine kinase [Burkholderiaceae bacterium]|nr:histidine kinase [Burkholderiaceae bacterium]
MDPNSGSTPNGGPDPASTGGVLRRAGSATVAGAKAAAPVVASGAAHSWSFFQQRVMPLLKRIFGRIGDWLATVGWGKFALVAILLLAAAGIATNVLYDEAPVVVIDRKAPKENVKVDIKVGPEGIRIERPGVPKPPAPPKAPEAPRSPDAPADKGASSVSIDEHGLRITSQRNGKPVQVVIDSDGIRVEDTATTPPTVEEPPAVVIDRSGAVVIPPDVAADPGKIELALESARQEIESIVQDQVNRKVAREVHTYRERSGDWLMSFAFLMILTGIIVKVVLGGKKRAERRAQAATATAAEESLKRQLVEAQLKMMQAQVEPHFLFNTLASVDYLIETDPPTASKMQKNLIQYLRAALPQMREGSTTLGKEIQLCRSYLEILKFRMEDRLHYTVTVPQGLQSAQFPPMMLQSLIENSIKHGLEPKPEGGAITISADIVDGRLRVTVADTGLGFAAASQPGTGVGLANVRERLAALYGGRARLSIDANHPSGTIVTIDVPYTFEADVPLQATPQPA